VYSWTYYRNILTFKESTMDKLPALSRPTFDHAFKNQCDRRFYIAYHFLLGNRITHASPDEVSWTTKNSCHQKTIGSQIMILLCSEIPGIDAQVGECNLFMTYFIIIRHNVHHLHQFASSYLA